MTFLSATSCRTRRCSGLTGEWRLFVVAWASRSSATLAGSACNEVVISTSKYPFVQLDEEAALRGDQPSFHWFAEGQHSDVRGHADLFDAYVLAQRQA